MKKVLIVLFVCAISFQFNALAQSEFKHPGMLHSKESLDLFKERTKSGKNPWASAWKDLKGSDYANLNRKPQAVSVISCGPHNKPNIGGKEFYEDSDFAYTMALLWYATEDERYAKKTIEIINAWSYTLDSVINVNKELKIGVGGIKYLNAAEIIKHTYKAWNAKDQKAFEKMLMDKWYSVIIDFKPLYNGNWDAAIGQTMMCIGIYLDRRDIFERAYNQLLDGESNGSIKYYFKDTGQCQESGRDQGHTQMGLSYLCNACEIAWTQGLDLYSAYNNRLMKGYEYTCKFMTGEKVPFEKYIRIDGRVADGNEVKRFRGNYFPIYERAYHHYHDRKGFDMPYTREIINITRNEGIESGFVPWSTLTSAESK